MNGAPSVAALRQMKRDGRKIVAAVVYDYQMAQIADHAGVDIVSAGDSVGVTMWGHTDESEITLDQILLVCRAVRRGVVRALVSCDVPLAPLHGGTQQALDAATRLVREGGADLVKVDVDASSVDAVGAIAGAGLSVWAQFSGVATAAAPTTDRYVLVARELERAGAALIDFRHSGPIAGPL